MTSRRPRIFTIPASAPFLPTLVDALRNDRLGLNLNAAVNPLALASATLYLPTRRACRLARDVFLQAIPSDAAILPRIVPIGDIDDDEIAFAEAAVGELTAEAIELPEALGGLERRMVLAELILKWAERIRPDDPAQSPLVASNPASALMLASDLARLMDDMATRQVSWDKLESLVQADMDEYWQKTLQFLKIAHEGWRNVLAATNSIEPAERRARLIEAESARLARHPGPVIAAGSTGSTPATAALIATIAGLPQGAVVLPGLDTDLDQTSWDMIGAREDADGAAHGHPQFALHALLRRIGIARDVVEPLTPPEPHSRERLASEAMRPAAATALWQSRLETDEFAGHADAALGTILVVEAANAEEEALAIAIALREALDTPDKTAALVTPDRALARRVLAALGRWSAQVDDSGGEALADMPAGVFARLVADAALDDLAPVKLLAMLKHPLCRVDSMAVTALERAVLRGPRPKAGIAGLRDALKSFRSEYDKARRREESELHRSDPRLDMRKGELDDAAALVEQLAGALAPLENLGPSPLPLSQIAERHRAVIEALGSLTEQLDDVFGEMIEGGRIPVRPADYPETLHAALSDVKVWSAETGARLRIYGTLESRLQNVDRVVLGGLVEGVWPPETRTDPWLSRPMRQSLGLDLPERRIGLSAHDFVQALGAKEVVLTRAARVAGAPTVASRFVQRLAAVAGKARWDKAVERGEKHLTWARQLDRPETAPKPIERPEPKPPRAARPKSLSVTEIETLLRDPYSIYARRVLGLRALDAVDTPLGARDRGSVIHEAIGIFTERFADRLPDDVFEQLVRYGEEEFAALQEYPDARAFWWPRFLRIARWFEQFEDERRPRIDKLYAEIRGTLEIPLGERTFTLSTRADRIEQLDDGSFAILDYKTGRVAGHKEVRIGLAPQLTLEAAILRAGGFGDFGRGKSVSEIAYVSIKGLEPAGEVTTINMDQTSPDEQADLALRKLTKLLIKFEDEGNGYLSKERPMFLRRFPGEYDHLARVKEWSLTGGADEDEAGGE